MSLFNRFYVKLSLLLLVLLIVMAAVHTAIAVRAYQRFEDEVDQRVNRSLAADMAAEIEAVSDGFEDLSIIGQTIHFMMVMNPAIEIYLLNPEGEIRAFYAQPGKEVHQEGVDLEPVHRFLDTDARLPIYGDDPRNPGQRKHFSAARLSMDGESEGYLYIVLRSGLYDATTSNLQQHYFVLALRNSLIIALPLVAVLGLFVFSLSTRRLQKLNLTVRAFGRGEMDKRAGASSADEIGELSESFNAMADTIVSNVEEIQQADLQRRELVGNISHDLRNPLASIQGYAEMLLEKNAELPPEERARYLAVLLRGTSAMSRLIEDLFELSKLDATDAAPTPEQFSLSELAQDLVLQMKPQADSRDITLELQRPDSLHLITGDVSMIERLMVNLIDNALKNTPSAGRVGIDLSGISGGIRVTVSDTGCGIAAEHLPYLFDRFYIGDESRSRSKTGSGLGLAISKRIVELHGGSIGVERSEGEGTVFFFELPDNGGTDHRSL